VDSAAVLPDPDLVLLDYQQVAARLGVSVRSVRRLVFAGDLEMVYVLGSRRIRSGDLDEYVAGLPAGNRTAGSHEAARRSSSRLVERRGHGDASSRVAVAGPGPDRGGSE